MRRPLSILSAALLLLAAGGCDSGGEGDDGPSGSVVVMSQNLYLGGDIFRLVEEPDPTRIPAVVADLYATALASDFPARAEAIADAIEDAGAHLVGLQEVTTYATQTPSDFVTGVTTPNATDVTVDFLDILLDALAARGLDYRVASLSPNADVELPATTDGQSFFDVRYRDADAILARADVATANAVEGSFETLVTVEVGGQGQTFVRGYQHVDATVDGFAFTFVNTHLEVGGPAEFVQSLQAIELDEALGAVAGPTVLVGDINSDGLTGGTSYNILTADFQDAAPNAGPTCCQDSDIRNETSELVTRIDVILTRGFVGATGAEVVLDEPSDRVGGLWPSDHAGVWAELEAGVGS